MKVKDKLVNVESLGGVFHIEAEARKDADNALSARINNIIAPDGDPSLTEITDARVSGQTTYNTLKSRLDAENEAINSKADVIKNDSYTLSEWELSSQNNLYPSKSDVIQYNDWNKIERKQNYIILDGENVSNLLRFAIFNDSDGKVSSTAPSYSNRPAWYSPINIFTVGHTYNISVQLVSGTYTFTGTSTLDNFIDVRTQADGALYQSKNSNWVCNKIPEMICFSVGKGVYSNAVFEISILDVTETNPIMHALKDSSAQKLSILFHTDIHANKGAIDAINAYIEENDSIIDEVISGGDMAQYEYSSSKNQYYFDSGLASKSLCVIGNHDSAVYGSNNTVDWWGKTKKEVYDRYLAPYITSWNVVQPIGAAESGLNYYYKDYSLIRIIFLDAMFWDASQRNWLVDVLADAKTNAMSVLIVAHGTDGKFTGDLNCSWTWVEKPNETGFYSNLRFNGTAVTAVDDFISGGGEFIGWLTGHSHLDRIGYMTDHPTQPVFNMNDSGTKTLDSRAAVFSCTMVVIDRVNKLVKLIRVGCNYDSYLKPKHTLCYNYQTQTLVSAYQVGQNTVNSIKTDVDDLKADLGDLSELETEVKTDLVSAINEAAQSGGGLTVDVKEALLACFAHVVWDDDDPTGQTYIDVLEDALYPPADLVSISAVYTQPGKVYSTDTLDSLKHDLVVTALMSDSSTRIVTEYTLSGTLAEGTSVITVTYGGKTTTFNVVVSNHLLYSLYNHEFTGDPSISPYINTGIQLFDEDFSWTIICELNKETTSPHGWRLFNALRGTSPYNGFYHGSSNDTKTGATNVKWVDSTTSNANTYMKGDWTGTYKCAFVHNFGSGLSEYFKGNNDSVVTKSLSNVWSQVSDAVPLGIGGVNGNTLNYALIGTIVKCEIYDYAFSSSEINAFMEGS